jgi:hypothetical protein
LQDEVLLEFHVDDTTRDDREDTLVEMAFHVPGSNEAWGGNLDDKEAPIPAAKVRTGFLYSHLLQCLLRACCAPAKGSFRGLPC